jgi:glycine oxidase
MKAISGRSQAGSVAVVGAGIIGLAIAWRLAQRNISVTVFEAGEPGRGASRAAAGMLSVVAETAPADRHFFELCRASRQLWPEFARELSRVANCNLDLREHGTLLVAQTKAEEATLNALMEAHEIDGAVRRLEPNEWRRYEPNLSTDMRAVCFAPEDGQVDNRATVRALIGALATLGVQIRAPEPVSRLMTRNGEVTGVATANAQYEFDLVILATGVETDALMQSSGLGDEALNITPVRGQTIALQMDPQAPLLRHVVRGETHYLVPRSAGALIVGATSEPGSFDLSVDPKATEFLIDGARRLVPAVAQLTFIDAWTGLRPLAQGGSPIIGEQVPGLILALGHYRNGVLLAPVTAEIVAGMVTTAMAPELETLATRYAPSSGRQALPM